MSVIVFILCFTFVGAQNVKENLTPGTDNFPEGPFVRSAGFILESALVLSGVSRRVKRTPVIGIQQKCGGEEH